MRIIQVVSLLLLLFIVPLACMKHKSTNQNTYTRDTQLFSAEGSSKKFARRFSKPLIGNDERVYACSGKDLLAIENNGSIARTIHLNHTCNSDIGPISGGREKIFVAAENMILKINLGNVGSSEPSVQIIITFQPEDKVGKGEIIGFSFSSLTSSIFVNIRGLGLFAYSMSGQVQWSTGPVLSQFGYRQGCGNNSMDCYFTSVPMIDRCEASVYISNNEGELYSLPIRTPHFKWVQDLSSFGKVFTITPGNNGRLYIVVPSKLLLALDVSTGSVMWQGSIGPSSSIDSTPIVDSNGWVSIGSLDGFLYSFSPSGVLKKFSKAKASDSAIQVSPVPDCSGYAIYISQTQFKGKVSREIGDYTYVSAMKPTRVVFTLFVPSTGSIYWSQTYPGESSTLMFDSTDLQNFVLDERTLLTFFAASKIGNKLACRSRSQKLISSCSQARPKLLGLYTDYERAIFLFLLFESVVLILLAVLVRFCCLFWKKKKVQDQDLGSFLDKRRSLRLKKKSFDRTIMELRSKTKEDNRTLEKLDSLVCERDGIKRKLSTTYSLGTDKLSSRSKKSLLPLYINNNEKRTKSLSFRGAKSERAVISQSSSDTRSDSDDESSWESFHEEELDENSNHNGIFATEIRNGDPSSSSMMSNWNVS